MSVTRWVLFTSGRGPPARHVALSSFEVHFAAGTAEFIEPTEERVLGPLPLSVGACRIRLRRH